MIFLKFAGLLFVLIAVSAEKVGNKAEKKVEKRDTNALLRSEGYRPVQGQLEFVEVMNEILFPNRSSSMFLYVYRNLWGWRVHYVLLPHKQLRWIDSDEKSGFHPSTRHRRIKKRFFKDEDDG